MRRCRLHDVELRYGTKAVRRGMPPAPPQGFFDAEESLFPNAKFFEIGGCLIPEPGSAEAHDEKRVWYCTTCREAQRSWQTGREVEDFWQI